MKRILLLALLTLLALPLAAQESLTASKTLPFTIELGDAINIDGAPSLQSFAAAVSSDGNKWLLISGRLTGLHTFNTTTPEKPVNNFPPYQLNDRAWVIEPGSGRVWS
ncbi:MAG: hypothetical protein QOH21_860, partial [Acidobacteriota bacterium]|nr:hypothetical protein [Acidobacteriota bacterium]